MKKKQLVELGQESLAGGDVPAELRGKYHQAVVEKFLEMAWEDILQNLFLTVGLDRMLFDSFAKPFKCFVLNDTDRGERYINLPIQLIPLTPKQAAIRSISMYRGQNVAFAPIQNTSLPMWGEMEAMRIDDTVAYYLEGQKIFFPGPNQPPIDGELMLKLICPFSAFEDDDQVSVPGGKNEMLFDAMYQFMNRRGNRAVEVNDNNSDQKL